MEFYRSNKENRISAVLSTLGRPAGEGGEERLTANTVDAAQEKHVPVIEQNGNEVTVIIGGVLHPMTQPHYIMWIGIETEEGFQMKHLTPDMVPSATFMITEGDTLLAAYEYCNLHGLWKTEV